MNESSTRYVIGGAAIGAVGGALAGLLLASRREPGGGAEDGVVARPSRKLSMRSLATLAGAVVTVVRQVLELSN